MASMLLATSKAVTQGPRSRIECLAVKEKSDQGTRKSDQEAEM